MLLGKILNRLELYYSTPRLRFLRTLYVNFRLLPYSQALKIPIFVYGPMKLFSLNGSIEFRDTPISRGMLKFGTLDPFSVFDGSGFLSLTSPQSKIICYGPAHIDVNAKIKILGNGQIILGKYVRVRSGVRIICNGSYIKIGDYTGIPFETQIINSSFHSVYDVTTRETKRNTLPIEIGSCCWIGNHSSITAGAKLKDYTIVCEGSYVNKDFTNRQEDYQLIGGRPAKLLKTGVRRVFSWDIESKIIAYFKKNQKQLTFIVPPELNDIINEQTVDF